MGQPEVLDHAALRFRSFVKSRLSAAVEIDARRRWRSMLGGGSHAVTRTSDA